MNGADQLSTIIPMLQAVGRGIEPDMLGGATPCAEFDVAAVLGHMTGLATAFAPAFRGTVPSEDPTPAGTDGLAAFDRAMAELLAAVHSEGAMERTLQTPGGPMVGADFARMVALDGMLHGWDLATATGQPWEPPNGLLSAVDEFARSALTAETRGDSFAPEREPTVDAGTMERLAAFSGRVVAQV
jgi:uncharacterized protein (TIGR03086 family)